MARNIVILLDGTSNGIKANRTNVLRLYGTLAKDAGQIVYYDPGVGTFGGDFAWSRLYRKSLEVWGLATGWGLDQNVLEAYRFLVETCGRDGVWAGPDADAIHIFGFSRGAYSARVLAGFINAFGLIEPRNLNLLTYAYRAYKAIGEGAAEKDPDDTAFDEMRLYARVLNPAHPPIRLLGLFDTVASVIERTRNGVGLRSHAFAAHNPSVAAVRHAVAIDERRTMFQPMLWPAGQEYLGGPTAQGGTLAQDLNEVWFRGVHGDIGGGYDEAESQLAKISLKWMIDETRALGLRYTEETVQLLVLGEGGKYVAPDPQGAMHDSMTAGWRILEFLPRRRPERSRRPAVAGWSIPFSERRILPEGARVHGSVLTGSADARPDNLPARYEVEGS